MMGRMLAITSLTKEAGMLFTDNLKSRHVGQFEIESPGMTYGDIKSICPILMVSSGGQYIYDMTDKLELKKGDSVYALVDPVTVRTLKEKLKPTGARVLE
jgi:hypothetical protein